MKQWERPEHASPMSCPDALRRTVVVIPAWQPDVHLVELVSALRGAGLRRMVIVNDGSTPDCDPLFAALARLPGVEVCRHARNRGKGAALKTAFRHILSHMPEVSGVVTADADGQHLPADILRVAGQLAARRDRAVLGVRSFTPDVPFRSRAGNLLTRTAFAVLTGCKVSDTQTGLRGLPVALLPRLLQLAGDRYEYEMVMLAHLCQSGPTPAELPIATVYLDQNCGSHFNPLWDSLRIYRVLLRSGVRRWHRRALQESKRDEPQLRPV